MLRSAEAQLLFYRFVLLDSLCLGWTGGRLQHVNHRQFIRERVEVSESSSSDLGGCVPEDGLSWTLAWRPAWLDFDLATVAPSYKSKDGLGETRPLYQACCKSPSCQLLCLYAASELSA